MAVNNIVLLTIVSIFIAYGHTAPEVLNAEFTFAQFEGDWFDIGRISSCIDVTPPPCNTHSITPLNFGTYNFGLHNTPYEKISNCDRGVPIYRWGVLGNFNNSKMYSDESDDYSAMNATIKSYNNGTELIFTDAQNKSCSDTSYRLWSRERKVSAETKAEFEKLAGNRIVEYFSWDHCPIVRSEVHEAPVDLVHDGLWYDIARIAFKGDNDTCCLHNITVNHANNTIDIVDNYIENGSPVAKVSRKYLSQFGTTVNVDRERKGYFNFYEISCNKGEQRITIGHGDTFIHLSSRNPKVPAEILTEFRRLFDKLKREINPNMVYTAYSHDDCPK